ncbi:tyrosine-type recombinase/integrase [Gammaproteobacteria bacterium]|nr:tyrosine-type recombinase/integrase [Gammaproteobacteria bacterium]
MSWDKEVGEIEHRRRLALKMGGEEGIRRQHERGKLTVRERIDHLADAGSFSQFMGLMGASGYENNELIDFTPRGAVEGFCHLDGRKVVLTGGDFTVRGGVPLRSIMNEAAERYEFSSPFKNIKPLKVSRTDVDPFTLAEVRQLIDHVRPDYKNYLIVRFFTGMRTGEVHGLKWKHVDFEHRQILVRESFVAGRQTTTKTDGSTREIQMSQPVFDALKQQSKVTCDFDYVFTNKAGNPLSVHNVTKRIWYPLLTRLALPPRRPYQTRHTAATLWLAAGENPEWIARQMGHSTTEMLFRIYSRYVPNLTRQDGSAFESLLNRTLNK